MPPALIRRRRRPGRDLAQVERLVERRLVDAVLARDLAQRAPAGRRVLDDLGRAVVADVRVERGGDGERAPPRSARSPRGWPRCPRRTSPRTARSRSASRWIDWSRLRAISGMRTLSSNWPWRPPIVIAVSLPITCALTWSTTSGSTGLTLPGMIEEPFCSSGRNSSPMPARGPEPISARSLAILVSETAITFSAPDSSTSASRLPCASNGSSGARIVEPGVGATAARAPARRTRGGCSGPVPVAVPPSGICATRGSASATRARPSRICAA